MAEKMIAYCGLVCTECLGFIATQSGDEEALERVAAQWSEEFNASLAAADCTCDGCTSGSERLSSHARSECEVRACAIGRNVITCAHCDDYARPGGCEKITGFFTFAPDAKTSLEGIRATL